MKCDIAIIGGGILGICISYWLSSLFKLDICVIEKESDIVMHASSRNTGMVHLPFYLNPEKKWTMAKSAILSHSMWRHVAQQYNIPWNNTGVLELALDSTQHRTLEKYMKWGMQNGIHEDSLVLLDASQVSKLEPNVSCHSAIHSSLDASTDFASLARIIKDQSARNGTRFLLQSKVTSIKSNISLSNGNTISAKFIINCAGGDSLDIAQLMGMAPGYSDLHFRGEYWIADPKHQNLAQTTIYTVPESEAYPFLDPHWIVKPDRTVQVGPNAVPVPGPEVYEGYVGDVASSISKMGQILTGSALHLLTDPEFLSMASKEWLSSLSKRVMISRIKRFLPRARTGFFNARGTAGIRSPVITPQGRFLSDVMELEDDRSFHIINYNSPGATGAPAYSALIVKKLHSRGLIDYTESRKEMLWNIPDIY